MGVSNAYVYIYHSTQEISKRSSPKYFHSNHQNPSKSLAAGWALSELYSSTIQERSSQFNAPFLTSDIQHPSRPLWRLTGKKKNLQTAEIWKIRYERVWMESGKFNLLVLIYGSDFERVRWNNLWRAAEKLLPTLVERKQGVFLSSHLLRLVRIDLHFASDTLNKRHHGPNQTLTELTALRSLMHVWTKINNKVVVLTTGLPLWGLVKFSHCSVEEGEVVEGEWNLCLILVAYLKPLFFQGKANKGG